MSRIRDNIGKLDLTSNLTRTDSNLTNLNDYKHTVKVTEENLNVSDKKLVEQAEHVKDILKLGDEEEISRNVLEGVRMYETREQVRDMMIELLIRDLNNSLETTKYLFITIVGLGLLVPLLVLTYKGVRHFYKYLVR